MAAATYPLLGEEELAFYRHALSVLTDAGIPHLVGGAYAYARYTGIERHTKDFDIFIREADWPRAEWAFKKAGYRTQLTFSHWIGKAYSGEFFVDLIFSAGNGVAAVDDLWFEKAVDAQVFGVDVKLIPAEEMIWSKGLIMERERFDGADVAHVIRAVGDKLDWRHVIDRFGPFWRGLFVHVILFGFVYPSERSKIPQWVVDELSQKMHDETRAGDSEEKVCYGTIISRQQYLKDIEDWGYEDARLTHELLTPKEIETWTAGIEVDGAT
jgi:hypothetical protein